MTASVVVHLGGFEEGIAKIRRARTEYKETVGEELQSWGDEEVRWFKNSVYANAFHLPHKKRPNGMPPLVDTQNYINHYIAKVDNYFTLGIVSEGMNTFMSNADLADLLEFGWKYHKPMPHLRPFAVHLQQDSKQLGDRIVRRLFG